jgi:Holliday junction resolvase-like predicted endonuclease
MRDILEIHLSCDYYNMSRFCFTKVKKERKREKGKKREKIKDKKREKIKDKKNIYFFLVNSPRK